MKAHGVVVAMPLGQQLGADPVDRWCGERGNHPVSPWVPWGQPVREWAGASSAVGAGWGGGLVVVAGVTTRHGGRESRSQGEGDQQVGSQERGWKTRRGAGEHRRMGAGPPPLLVAERRVLEIQTKLHRWAGDDPHRRFDDLFNLVADPGFLLVAWDQVGGNKGAGTGGVDGQTAYYVEAEVGGRGVSRPAAGRDQGPQFPPAPGTGADDPETGYDETSPPGDLRHPGPGGPGVLETGAGADLRGGFPPVFVRVPPRTAGFTTRWPRYAISRPARMSGSWRATSEGLFRRDLAFRSAGPGAGTSRGQTRAGPGQGVPQGRDPR